MSIIVDQSIQREGPARNKKEIEEGFVAAKKLGYAKKPPMIRRLFGGTSAMLRGSSARPVYSARFNMMA